MLSGIRSDGYRAGHSEPFNYIQIPIRSYFRYFAGRQAEDDWGAYVSSVGRTRIVPGKAYPPPGHPGGRQFRWENGRVLPVFQMIAIRSGRGTVEWEDGARPVSAGMAFFLLPGEWHRYRPAISTGWIEEWVELRGSLLDRWTCAGLFRERVVSLPKTAPIFETFETLHHLASHAGQKAASNPGQLLGLAITLISQAVGSRENPESARSGTHAEHLVERAAEALRDGLGVTETARALGISYPTLHRYFVAVRGISPKQAAVQMRRARAEALLAEGKLSIKEIAATIGFHSASHFSLSFKRDYGSSPSAWRKK